VFVAQSTHRNDRALYLAAGELIVSSPLQNRLYTAEPSDRFTEGDLLWCKDKSATVAMDYQQGLIKCSAGTKLKVKTLDVAAGQTITKLRLQQGALDTAVVPPTNKSRLSLEIKDPTDSISVKVHGTHFAVRAAKGNRFLVGTSEGEVRVSSMGEQVTLTAGEATSVIPGQPPIKPVRDAHAFDIQSESYKFLDARTVQFRGRVNPVSVVESENGELEVDQNGWFKSVSTLPPDQAFKTFFVSNAGATQKKVFSYKVRD
jgi:hypothetical protein